ncbi:hypothetical protein Trydic_g22204 [Trypoxylus dichotomus]
MGIHDFAISTNHPFNKYSPGQTVRGKVHFSLDEPKAVRGVYVKLKGVVKISWSEKQRSGVGSKKNTRYITYYAKHEYFNDKIYLAGAEDGEKYDLSEGDYDYKFQYDLPNHLPSSFKGNHGSIEYTIKAALDIPFGFDDEEETILDISSPVHLSEMAYLQRPDHRKAQKNLCCCCCQSGAITLEMHLEKTGYVYGERIPIKLDLENGSSTKITEVECKLKKIITYHSEFPRHNVKDEEMVLCKKQLPGVAKQSAEVYEEMLTVPVDIDINFANCRFLEVQYMVQINVGISGCHSDMNVQIPLTLGLGSPYPYEPGHGDTSERLSKSFNDASGWETPIETDGGESSKLKP